MKKIVITVVVFDRIGNFIKWLKIARKIKNEIRNFEVEIRIVHHTDNPVLCASWKKIATNYPVTYLNRANKGFDIGVFQAVCEKTLPNFNYDFDFLIWFTDDCFPTNINFLEKFVEPFDNPLTSISCFDISTEVRPHARTTGFCIRKETLDKIKFPVPVITTKDNCYKFEHGQDNLLVQIKRMGLEAKQIEGNIFHNLDSKRVKRYGFENSLQDLYKFLYENKEPPVLVFATAYNRYPQIVSSVLCQKYGNVNLKVWHNGELDAENADVACYYVDQHRYDGKPRLEWDNLFFIPGNHFGHPIKKMFLEQMRDHHYEYLLITNEDNYISPYMIQKAVETLEKHPDKIGAYCGGMIHNYQADFTSHAGRSWKEKRKIVDGHAIDGYGLINCKIERGYIDISSIVFRASVALSVPWNDASHSSDWTYIENIANAFGGKDKYTSFPGVHLVHN